MATFLRSDTMRHSRLGKNRPKLQKWRRPKGRHSKIRKKRAGYPGSPSIGHGSPRKSLHLVNGKLPVVVHNMQELEQVDKQNAVVFSRRLGAKKRVELLKKATEMKVTVLNGRNK